MVGKVQEARQGGSNYFIDCFFVVHRKQCQRFLEGALVAPDSVM
jgi:hypothetical protein